MMIEYVASSALWSLVGLVVGFVFGRTYREVHEIRETVVPHRIVENHNLLGIIILILSVATVSAGAVSVIGQQRIVECQADYNAGITASIIARDQAATADREALTSMVEMIAASYDNPPEVGREQVRDAIDAYVEQVSISDAARAQAPLPDPPDPNTCR